MFWTEAAQLFVWRCQDLCVKSRHRLRTRTNVCFDSSNLQLQSPPAPIAEHRPRKRLADLSLAQDMFGSSITRAARSACAPNSARAPLTAASYPLLWCTSSSHQRRLSSSKTSIPPNGATRGRSAAPTQQTATSSSGRVSRRKTKVAVVESRFARLPSVPSTEHLSDAGMYTRNIP